MDLLVPQDLHWLGRGKLMFSEEGANKGQQSSMLQEGPLLPHPEREETSGAASPGQKRKPREGEAFWPPSRQPEERKCSQSLMTQPDGPAVAKMTDIGLGVEDRTSAGAPEANQESPTPTTVPCSSLDPFPWAEPQLLSCTLRALAWPSSKKGAQPSLLLSAQGVIPTPTKEVKVPGREAAQRKGICPSPASRAWLVLEELLPPWRVSAEGQASSPGEPLWSGVRQKALFSLDPVPASYQGAVTQEALPACHGPSFPLLGWLWKVRWPSSDVPSCKKPSGSPQNQADSTSPSLRPPLGSSPLPGPR